MVNIPKVTINLVNYLNELVHLPFLELSIINFGDNQDKNSSQQYRSWSNCILISADWPGSILVAKVNYFWF